MTMVSGCAGGDAKREREKSGMGGRVEGCLVGVYMRGIGRQEGKKKVAREGGSKGGSY